MSAALHAFIYGAGAFALAVIIHDVRAAWPRIVALLEEAHDDDN